MVLRQNQKLLYYDRNEASDARVAQKKYLHITNQGANIQGK